MRRLFESWVVKGAVTLAFVGGTSASLPNVLAEDAIEQEIVVLTSDDDEDGEETKAHAQIRVVHAPKRWLGIMLKNVEGDLARYLDTEVGILVDSVMEGSPADKAGLRDGDILLSVGDSELGEPQDLMAIMSELDEDGDEALELKVLRKGDHVSVKVTPAKRPENLEEIVVHDLEDLHIDLADAADVGDEVKKTLKRLRIGDLDKDMNILRFGNPSMIFRGHGKGESHKGNIKAQIVRDVDGKKVEVEVVREDQKPVVITVTKDGEVTKYSADDLEELPEEIAVIVEPIIDGKGGLHIGGKVHVVGPNLDDIEIGNINREEIIKRAKEMAERARASAEEVRSRVRRVRGSDQVADLKAMVEELRAEVAKLRAELNDK